MMIPVSSPPADNRILTTWFPNMKLVQMGCSNCGIITTWKTSETTEFVCCSDCGEVLVRVPSGIIFTWCDRRVV